MKNNRLLSTLLAVFGLLAPILSVTAQPAATGNPNSQWTLSLAQPGGPAGVPGTNTVKTSFTEVTSQLDPGGDCYVYLGLAQWLTHLSAKVEGWRHSFMAIPDTKTNDLDNINHAFDVLSHVITDSGIQDLSGVGMSSIEIAPGLHRTKIVMHHYPGQGEGFMWKLYGTQPHPLGGLDLLPANTALAYFYEADVPLLWSVIKDETAKSGFPQAQALLEQVPAQFEKNTRMSWDAFLGSLGGEFGMVLTLDESNPIVLPLPTGMINMPAPGLLLAVRVKDDTIFNSIAQQLKTNQDVISVETNGLRMRTMPIPLPLPVDLRPTAASSGGYLLIATSDSLVQQILAVKSGAQPGLKSTAEFKRLSQGIPEQGNQFCYMSPSFSRALLQIQKQAMASGAHGSSAAQTEWMQSLMHSDREQFSYAVGMTTPEGWVTVGNSSQSGAAIVLLPAMVIPGLLAAIAVPNFVKARASSQENACINNLRMIDAAKSQWALEKSKTATDVPTEDDLKPYLINSAFPVCPQGGTYTIGAVGDKPTCTIPGHVLPAN